VSCRPKRPIRPPDRGPATWSAVPLSFVLLLFVVATVPVVLGAVVLVDRDDEIEALRRRGEELESDRD
jgi:hypothetical protein